MRMTSKPLSRRRLIAGFVSTAALTWTAGIAKPYLSRATDRPLITHGLQSGDIGVDSGVVWARSDRPARMQIEIATTDSFRDIRGGAFVDALPDSDFTAKLLLKELPASQDIFSDDRRRADGGPLSHRAERSPFDFVLLVGRSSRPGLGH